MASEANNDVDRILTMLEGYRETCVIMAACNLGVFEALKDGPLPLETLADQLGAHPPSLRRLSQALVAIGLVVEAFAKVELSELGRLLVEGESIAAPWAVMVEEEYLPTWSELSWSIRSGQPAYPHVFGESVWTRRAANPRTNAAFNQAMSAAQNWALEVFLETYDLSAAGTIVDIGGGRGDWLAGILRKHRQATGILYDQPHVLAQTCEALSEKELLNRCQLVHGSFLDSVPGGGDVLILKYCLHNWEDHDCLRILKNCRQAMSPASRLLLLENVHPQTISPEHRRQAMVDLHMLLVPGGRERTLEEFKQLAEEAGLRLEHFFSTRGAAPDVLDLRPA